MDLQSKSDEFIELYRKANPLPNARAKVPLIQVGDDTFLCESMVVTEYLAEIYSSPLIPEESADRATMRLFVELCGSTFSYFPLLRATEEEAFNTALETFKEGLINTNSFLAQSPPGPFCLGNQFSLAECIIAPFLQRCCTILPAFTGKKDLPTVDPMVLCDELQLSHLKEWIEAVLKRPSVISTGVPSDEMIASTTRMLERFATMAQR